MVLKISPYIDDKEIPLIIDLTEEFGLKGLIVSNTTDKNRENLKGINKNQEGGLSGEPLSEISNKEKNWSD